MATRGRGLGVSSGYAVLFEESGVSLVERGVGGVLIRCVLDGADLGAARIDLRAVHDGGVALQDRVPGVVADLDRGGGDAAGVADDEPLTGVEAGHPGVGGPRGDHARSARRGKAGPALEGAD